MDIVNTFKAAYLNGNSEILLAITRSLKTENKKIIIDRQRLRNELELYKAMENKGFASITSALIPVIIAHRGVKEASEGAMELFCQIRKKISQRNKIGITFLCHLLFNADSFEENFANYTMQNEVKEDEIEFQKQKINIILGKTTIMEAIVDLLEEIDKTQNEDLLQRILLQEKITAQDMLLAQMEQYFVKLVNCDINPPALKGDFSLKNILAVPAGESGIDPLLGRYQIVQKDETKITLECKRGELRLQRKYA